MPYPPPYPYPHPPPNLIQAQPTNLVAPAPGQPIPDFDMSVYAAALDLKDAEVSLLVEMGFEGDCLASIKTEDAFTAGFKLFPWKRLVEKDQEYRKANGL